MLPYSAFLLSRPFPQVRADIEVTCYTYEGVDAVKDALRAGVACSTEDMPITIKLVAPPR